MKSPSHKTQTLYSALKSTQTRSTRAVAFLFLAITKDANTYEYTINNTNTTHNSNILVLTVLCDDACALSLEEAEVTLWSVGFSHGSY